MENIVSKLKEDMNCQRLESWKKTGIGNEIGRRRNENATINVRSTKLEKIRNERIRGTTKVGEIAKKVQERRLKWYGHVMRREEHYVGRRVMEMKVQGRRKRGRPKRRWMDKVKDDIKACWLMKCMTVLHGGVSHRTSTPHKGGNKMKEEKKKKAKAGDP